MKELVIFAMDKGHQLSGLSKVVMEALKTHFPNEPILQAEGSYKGEVEESWVVSKPVFDEIQFTRPELIREQECFLRIPTDGKNYPYLEFRDGSSQTVNRLTQSTSVNPGEDYTYVLDTDTYYTIKKSGV